jgi:hypothetical protein
MRQYLVAALSTVILVGPAEAVDLGVDVQAGGVSAGADVSVSPAGTSLGTGTSGLGQVNAGASVATGKSEIGASGSVSVGTSSHIDSASGSLSAGAKASAATSAGAASTVGVASTAGAVSPAGEASSGLGIAPSDSKATGSAATNARVAPAEAIGESLVLPRLLRPAGRSDRAPWGPIEAVPGTPSAVVRVCQDAIESAAVQYGVISVRAKSGGTLRRLAGGAVSAPVHVRIHYARQGGGEIRQARIRCQLDANGRVVKLT